MAQSLFMGWLLVLLATLALTPAARAIGLVDQPGGRKHHDNDTPLMGGPAIALMMLALPWFSSLPNPNWFVLAGGLLVVTGMIDDKHHISASLKLAIQLMAATLAVIGGGAIVTNFGLFFSEDLTGSYNVSIVFSIIAITGMINAFNMIDGIDGLAASLAIFALLCLIGLVYLINGAVDPYYMQLCAAVIGGIAAFLLFNLGLIPRHKIFLGDSGSMLIGFLVGVLLIKASEGALDQGHRPFPTAMVLWITAVPVIDTISLIFRRLARGVSPFSPDRTHFHHLIMSTGAAPRQTLLIIVLVASALAGLGGLITYYGGSAVSITVWVAIFVSYLSFSIIAGRRKK